MTPGAVRPRQSRLRGFTCKLAGAAAALLFVLYAAAQPAGPSGPQHNPADNVTVGDRTLFTIDAPFGPFSPAERAQAANLKLAEIVKDAAVKPASIVLADRETSTDILAADLVVTTVTDPDAAAAGVSRTVLAQRRLDEIRQGVAAVRAEYSYKSLLLGGLYALTVTLILAGMLLLFRRLAPGIYGAIERSRGTRIRTVKIQSLELVSADRIADLLLHSVRLARAIVTLLLFYFYIPLVFSFFPWTRSFGVTLLGYILSPVARGWSAFTSYLPSLLVVLLVFAFAYFAIRLARFFFRELEKGTIGWPGFYPEWASPTCRIVEFLTVAFALVVVFPYLPGSNSAGFRGVSIFLGVLFSLGSTSAVANIIAGVILTYTRAFRIGDRVQVSDAVGDVISRTLLATQIRTIKNVQITIPNALVLGSHVINFSASAEGRPLILHTGVTIGYSAPWRQVHELLIAAARKTAGILPDPAPFVLQTSLDDFYVSYQINAYTDQPCSMASIYSDLHQNIQDAFNEAGVEILSPHYAALRDGNSQGIPESWLPEGYEPASFRISPTRKGGGKNRPDQIWSDKV